MSKLLSKAEVTDYIWQYSKYYGNLLGACERIASDEEGHASLLYLFNLVEMIFKDKLKDYDSRFIDIIKELKHRELINNLEYNFLNDNRIGIRKIRNILAHTNLSKYNFVFIDEDGELLFPLTENETCIKLYNLFSDVLFNIMLKVIIPDLITTLNMDLDEIIKGINIEIREISPEKLLEYKGIDYREIDGWSQMTEDDRYRLAENSSDVNILTSIFRNLLD